LGATIHCYGNKTTYLTGEKLKIYKRIGALIIQNKKILFVGGKDGPADYWTPGGKVEPGESEEETIKREVAEEVGLEVTKTVFFKEYHSPSPFSNDTEVISRTYLVEANGTPKPGNEITRLLWLSLKEAEKYYLTLLDKETLLPDLAKKGLL